MFPPRKRIDIYQEKIIGLESQVALMSRVHSRDLFSQLLGDKLRLLGDPSSKQSRGWTLSRQLAFWPYDTIPIRAAPAVPRGRIVDEELETGFAPAVPREMMGQMVHTWTPIFDGSPLPPSFSLWMCVFPSRKYDHKLETQNFFFYFLGYGYFFLIAFIISIL